MIHYCEFRKLYIHKMNIDRYVDTDITFTFRRYLCNLFKDCGPMLNFCFLFQLITYGFSFLSFPPEIY